MLAHPGPDGDALSVSGTDKQAEIGVDKAFPILLNQNAPPRGHGRAQALSSSAEPLVKSDTLASRVTQLCAQACHSAFFALQLVLGRVMLLGSQALPVLP